MDAASDADAQSPNTPPPDAGVTVRETHSTCAPDQEPKNIVDACFRGSGEKAVGTALLTVVGPRPGNVQSCFADVVGRNKGHLATGNTGPRVGWIFHDENGDDWLVEFVAPNMPQSLLSPGDKVEFSAPATCRSKDLPMDTSNCHAPAA
jgi:hypothetical protein